MLPENVKLENAHVDGLVETESQQYTYESFKILKK